MTKASTMVHMARPFKSILRRELKFGEKISELKVSRFLSEIFCLGFMSFWLQRVKSNILEKTIKIVFLLAPIR